MAMHVFGMLTTASSIQELDEVLISCTVIFSSPFSSGNVGKHFENIQHLLTNIGYPSADESSIAPMELEVTTHTHAYMYKLICMHNFFFWEMLAVFNLCVSGDHSSNTVSTPLHGCDK